MKRLCEAVALIGNIFGAILVALGGKYPSLAIVGYSFFLAGALSSIWLLRHSNASKSLIFINVYFVTVNIIGIFVRIH